MKHRLGTLLGWTALVLPIVALIVSIVCLSLVLHNASLIDKYNRQTIYYLQLTEEYLNQVDMNLRQTQSVVATIPSSNSCKYISHLNVSEGGLDFRSNEYFIYYGSSQTTTRIEQEIYDKTSISVCSWSEQPQEVCHNNCSVQ